MAENSTDAPPPHEPIKIELPDQTPTDTTSSSTPNYLPNTTTAGASSAPDLNPPLSKNQQKKLLKKQQWEEGRPARKAFRRQKDKERKIRRREREQAVQQTLAGEVDANGESSTAFENLSGITPTLSGGGAQRKIRRDPKKTKQVPITIIFDCSYDELMTENEVMSLGAQITRCYADNKNALYRAHLAVSSFGGRMRERYEGLLRSQHRHWKGIRFCEEDFVKVAEMAQEWMREGKTGGVVAGALASDEFPVEEKIAEANEQTADADEKTAVAVEETATRQSHQDIPTFPIHDEPGHPGEVVYLSSDSAHTLTHLSPYSTYIIGGLVDRNRHKGVCYKAALDAGIKTAKLPIGEFMQMSSRQVLATNHVNEIMINWLEDGDWGSAFDRVIPKRKGGVLKSKADKDAKKSDGGADEEVEEEDEDDADEDGGVNLEIGNEDDEDDEPVTAEDQVDVAGRQGHPNQQANLKRKVVDNQEPDDGKRPRANGT